MPQTPGTAPTVEWEFVQQNSNGPSMLSRAPVEGGWLVWAKAVSGSAHMGGLTFVPDPDHRWGQPGTE